LLLKRVALTPFSIKEKAIKKQEGKADFDQKEVFSLQRGVK